MQLRIFLMLVWVALLAGCGGSDSDESVFFVLPAPNQAPTAAFTVSSGTLYTNPPVEFDARSSSDSDGVILQYDWDFGDGNTASGRQVSHSYSAAGDYTVTLTVTDNRGATAETSRQITVMANLLPMPSLAISPDPDGQSAPITLSLDGSGSADFDDNIVSYRWDFGDGQTQTVYDSSGNPPAIVHDYNAAGTYTVTLEVTDSRGASASTSRQFTLSGVNNPPTPVISASHQTQVAGQPVDFSAAASTDDGLIIGYDWDFGDGSIHASSVDSSHVYGVSGNYTVTLTLTDNNNAQASATYDVTVIPAGAFDISGTILITPGTTVDRDVNDVNTSRVANDVTASAQPLENPGTAGGFINDVASGNGSGQLFASGDAADVYAVTLTGSEDIVLWIADDADLQLELLASDGSTSVAVSTIDNPATGNYTEVIAASSIPDNANGASFYIRVTTAGGGTAYASNYVLQVGNNLAVIASAANDFEPGDILVRFADDALPLVGVNDPAYRASSVGLKLKHGRPGESMLLSLGDFNHPSAWLAANRGGTFLAAGQTTTGDSEAALKAATLAAVRELNGRQDVLHAEPNYRYHPTLAPNDAYYSSQWHYPLIHLEEAWALTTGLNSVVAAVIDTGVLKNHPEITGKLSGDEWDFVGNDNDADDPGDASGPGATSSFHGTHVAGTIAAATNDGAGVAGVGWDTRIMPLRVLGPRGGTCSDIAEAIKYAAGLPNASGQLPAQSADIINLSLGGSIGCSALTEAVTSARGQGKIVIAAAGNAGSTTPFYPAALSGVVSVSAVDAVKNLAPYSNRGSTIDIAAPGGDLSADRNNDGFADGILSTAGDDSSGSVVMGYAFYEGTSMAAPHVSGVVALMRSLNNSITPDLFDSWLAAGDLTEDLGAPGRDNSFGHGLIHALKAVNKANAGGSAPPNLVVNPGSLSFPAGTSVLTLAASNSGTGSLTIQNVTKTASWLSITGPGSGDGLGDYTISVDRTGLSDGIYTDSIVFGSDANSVSVPVTLVVSSVSASDDAGLHYVLLVDAETLEVVSGGQAMVSASGGSYSFSLTNIPAGNYKLFAGTDLDNDGSVCDPGEACAAWPTLSDPATIQLTADTAGLTFTTGFSASIGGADTQGQRRPVIQRLQEQPVKTLAR